MAWKITVDHISDPAWPAETSRVGRGNYPKGVRDSMMKHKWRAFDADGELYYEGISSDDSDFAPLDFATADAGATVLKYKVGNAWKEL